MRAALLTRPARARTNVTLLAITGVGAALLVAALEYRNSHAPASEVATKVDPAQLRAGYGPTNFDAALTDANRNVAAKRTLLTGAPGEWVRMEGMALALLARARLTADPADMVEANRLLAKGIDSAPWPAGPVLSRAGGALLVHDLAGVEKALARFDASVTSPGTIEETEARSMRCEVAFERGDLARAKALCGDPTDVGQSLRRANIALASGDAPTAARLVEDVLRTPRQSPLQLAKLMLQRTAIALAMGDWEASGRWARAADKVFPGYWLTHAFLAQQRALEGDTAGAEAAYKAIAEKTGNPDVYGALIVLASERGDETARRAYLDAAAKGWARRVSLLPATYASHYGEFLALNGDVEGGLRATGGDYASRPYLQPMTDYVFVLAHAGDNRRVVEVVERGEKAGFRSATLLLAKADALQALGREAESRESRAAAKRINPRIENPSQAFVHFRQD